MSPLAFVQWLRDDLQASYPGALPPPFSAQLGDLVVDCQGTFLTGLTVTEQDVSGVGSNCDTIQMMDLVVAVARDCAFVANDDGTTDHAQMDTVSAQMDADSVLLTEWADKLVAASWYVFGRPTQTFIVQGGLATTTLNVSLPVP